MSEFRISEQQYRKFRKRFLAYFLPYLAIILVLAIGMGRYSGNMGDIEVTVITISILVIYIGFIFYRVLRRQRRLMLSFRVTVSDSEITREQYNTPTITINFMEIKEIIRTKKGVFVIKGLGPKDVIAIPRWVDDKPELERQLQAFAPITTDKKDPLQLRIRILRFLLIVALYVCLLTLKDKIVIGTCGLALAGLLCWSLYEVQTSKNVTRGAKRGSWYLLIIIAGVLYMTYIKLTLPVF